MRYEFKNGRLGLSEDVLCNQRPDGYGSMLEMMLELVSRSTFVRFILVGILNTIFGYLLYAFFVLISIDYRVSLVLVTLITIAFNFGTYSRLVFKTNDNRLIFKFVLVYGSIFFLNEGLLILLVTHDVGELVGQAILVPVIAATSFILNRLWVFPKERLSNN